MSRLRKATGRLLGMRLSTRLGLTLTMILILAAIAQSLLYFKTRDETLEEANQTYQGLAKAIEVAATQVGPEGWKDPKVLADYTRALEARGMRDIQVTDATGRPYPAPTAGPGSRRGKAAPPGTPKDILISGIVGSGLPNRTLEIPFVVGGRMLGHIQIQYSLENIRGQLADNFRRRLFALLGVFALGLAIMLVVTRNATRPLDELADGAARVAEGKLDVRVPVDRDDEIGRLAATVNRMTESLRERQELENRLLAAEKRAEISHLASGLAHEIKNPLNALSLGLDVLKRRHRPPDPAQDADYAARIEQLREEINRLATLINNFLAFGRPLSLQLQPTDVSELLAHTVEDLSETAAKAHVEVTTDIAPDLPRTLVDASLLKSAIWNLLQNAIQSLERSGGHVAVALHLDGDSSDGRPLVLTVEDDGAGIDPADLPRLFEPYFSRKEGGVGLGLAMVKKIVQDHGGKVTASPRAEGAPGACFRIALPAGIASPA